MSLNMCVPDRVFFFFFLKINSGGHVKVSNFCSCTSNRFTDTQKNCVSELSSRTWTTTRARRSCSESRRRERVTTTVTCGTCHTTTSPMKTHIETSGSTRPLARFRPGTGRVARILPLTTNCNRQPVCRTPVRRWRSTPGRSTLRWRGLGSWTSWRTMRPPTTTPTSVNHTGTTTSTLWGTTRPTLRNNTSRGLSANRLATTTASRTREHS